MGRPTEEIEDSTPLNGSRIDIGARIGWLLRVTRLAHGVSLRELAAVLAARGAPYSTSTLSRLETSGSRSGAVVHAYEQALGLPYGWLRAPVDVLCRTFAYAPADQEPHQPEVSLFGFTAVCDAVATEEATGHDWLRFAEIHASGSFGLPATQARPLIAKLASELGRSVTVGYTTRYEALAKLRCSAYGDLVADVVPEIVAAPDVQVLNDLMSAVSERPTPELLAWCGTLFDDDSFVVMKAATLAVQNMRSVGGLPEEAWLALAPVFAAAYVRTKRASDRRRALSTLLATCAPSFRRAVGALLPAPPDPVRGPAGWTRDRRNVHYAFADELAGVVCAGKPGEPMLARLIFEMLYDFRATHVVTSSFLVNASPFGAALQPLLSAAALDGPDEATRHGAANAFSALMMPWEQPDLDPWLASADPVIRRAGLVVAGHAGVPLPEPTLRALLTGPPDEARAALFAAGMPCHPLLPELAADETLPGEVRRAAAWWIRQGGRLTR